MKVDDIMNYRAMEKKFDKLASILRRKHALENFGTEDIRYDGNPSFKLYDDKIVLHYCVMPKNGNHNYINTESCFASPYGNGDMFVDITYSYNDFCEQCYTIGENQKVVLEVYNGK